MWLALIALHATSGMGAFGAGIAALSRHRVERHRWIPKVVTWALIGLVAFVLGAIGAHWGELSGVERTLFAGLIALAGVMCWRARQAERIASNSISDEWTQYVDHVGFVLISLFNGFVIVGTLDLGAPPVIVAGAAVAATTGGHLALTHHKERNMPRAAPASEVPLL